MPANNIDDVIAMAPGDVAIVAHIDGAGALLAAMLDWTNTMFAAVPGTPPIFPPDRNATHNPGQRVVTAWYGTHLQALRAIGPTVQLEAVARIQDAVMRVACAVKYGGLDGHITGAQENAVVALYNATWAP